MKVVYITKAWWKWHSRQWRREIWEERDGSGSERMHGKEIWDVAQSRKVDYTFCSCDDGITRNRAGDIERRYREVTFFCLCVPEISDHRWYQCIMGVSFKMGMRERGNAVIRNVNHQIKNVYEWYNEHAKKGGGGHQVFSSLNWILEEIL